MFRNHHPMVIRVRFVRLVFEGLVPTYSSVAAHVLWRCFGHFPSLEFGSFPSTLDIYLNSSLCGVLFSLGGSVRSLVSFFSRPQFWFATVLIVIKRPHLLRDMHVRIHSDISGFVQRPRRRGSAGSQVLNNWVLSFRVFLES